MSLRQWPKPFWPAKMVVEGVFLCTPGILSPLPGLIVHFSYVGHFCFLLDQFWTIWERLRNFYKDKRILIIQLSYLQDLLMEKQLVCTIWNNYWYMMLCFENCISLEIFYVKRDFTSSKCNRKISTFQLFVPFITLIVPIYWIWLEPLVTS